MGWAAPHAAWLLAAALPFALWAMWTDLTQLKISNVCSIGLFLAFLLVTLGWWVTGAEPLMPISLIGWHALHAAIVLAVGFLLFAVGQMGGGDAKMLAAAAPYVAPGDWSTGLLILAVSMLLSLPLLAVARRIRVAAGSWRKSKVPLAFAISAALLTYLGLGLA